MSHVEHGFKRKTMMSQPKLGYFHLFLLVCRKLQPWRAATKLSANFQPSIHVYSNINAIFKMGGQPQSNGTAHLHPQHK